MRRRFLALLLLLAAAANVYATDRVATGVGYAAVKAAYDLANDGDKVVIPAGSATWTTTLDMTKAITLEGAGDTTVITPGAGVTNGTLIKMTVKSGSNSRISKIRFEDNDAGAVGFMITVQGGDPTDTTHGWEIDRCNFNSFVPFNGNQGAFLISVQANAQTGVIDHNRFGFFQGESSYVQPGGYLGYSNGDGSWNDDFYVGALTRATYVEDNVFESKEFSIDGKAGTRTIYRHNTYLNSNVQTHGSEDSSGRGRGTMVMDIYNNQIYRADPNGTNGAYTSIAGSFITLRGGSARIFNNYVDDAPWQGGGSYGSAWIQIRGGTIGQSATGWGGVSGYTTKAGSAGPSGGADGLNPWHQNVTGTIQSPPGSGNNLVPISTPAPWAGAGSVYKDVASYGGATVSTYGTITLPIGGPTVVANCFKYFTLINLTKRAVNSALNYYYFISANTANSTPGGDVTVTLQDTRYGADTGMASIAAGDHLQITKVDKILDGPGRGKGDLVTGDNPLNSTTGTKIQPHQTDWGVFIWNNKVRHKIPASNDYTNWTAATTTVAWPYNTNNGAGDAGTLAPIRVERDVFNRAPDGATTTADLQGTYSWNAAQIGQYVGADDVVRGLGYNTNYPARFTVTGGGGAAYPHFLVSQTVTPPDQITISGPASVNEGNTITFSLNDSFNAGSDVGVTYTVAGVGANPAISGTDFTAPSGTATIAAGTRTKAVVLTTLVNPSAGDKTASITINTVSPGNTIGSPTTVFFTIKDATVPFPAVSAAVSPTIGDEGVGSTFTLTGTIAAPTATLINYSVSGTAAAPTNYTALPGSVTMPFGATSVNIPLSTNNIGSMGGDKTVILTVTSGGGYTVGTTSSATYTIRQVNVISTPTPPAILQVKP